MVNDDDDVDDDYIPLILEFGDASKSNFVVSND
jgi:hypothetical protein